MRLVLAAAMAGSAILGSAGNEADWEYPMSSVGTFSTPTLSVHSCQGYVHYTCYNDARQVMATDMHAAEQLQPRLLGYSGRVWIPTNSAVSCKRSCKR